MEKKVADRHRSSGRPARFRSKLSDQSAAADSRRRLRRHILHLRSFSSSIEESDVEVEAAAEDVTSGLSYCKALANESDLRSTDIFPALNGETDAVVTNFSSRLQPEDVNCFPVLSTVAENSSVAKILTCATGDNQDVRIHDISNCAAQLTTGKLAETSEAIDLPHKNCICTDTFYSLPVKTSASALDSQVSQSDGSPRSSKLCSNSQTQEISDCSNDGVTGITETTTSASLGPSETADSAVEVMGSALGGIPCQSQCDKQDIAGFALTQTGTTGSHGCDRDICQVKNEKVCIVHKYYENESPMYPESDAECNSQHSTAYASDSDSDEVFTTNCTGFSNYRNRAGQPLKAKAGQQTIGPACQSQQEPTTSVGPAQSSRHHKTRHVGRGPLTRGEVPRATSFRCDSLDMSDDDEQKVKLQSDGYTKAAAVAKDP